MAYISVVFLNLGITAGWIFLAVHFDHWWIALFSLATLFKVTNKDKNVSSS